MVKKQNIGDTFIKPYSGRNKIDSLEIYLKLKPSNAKKIQWGYE